MRKPKALILCEEAAEAAGWKHTTSRRRTIDFLEPVQGWEFTATLGDLVIAAQWDLDTATNRMYLSFASLNNKKDPGAAAATPHLIQPTGYRLRAHQAIGFLKHPEKLRKSLENRQG